MDKTALQQYLLSQLGEQLTSVQIKDMVTVELEPEQLIPVCLSLRDTPELKFELLLDVCGVDYLDYGVTHWRTEETTASGYSRAVKPDERARVIPWDKPRFGVVYHLLSVAHNHRLRLKTYLSGEPQLPSVIDVWPAANWYEREAYDLYGIVFEGHPDLRRILTDYGFHGHPFRKDFPLIGEVELRYDAASDRCVYEPVGIQPRVLVPKVVRRDQRYSHLTSDADQTGSTDA